MPISFKMFRNYQVLIMMALTHALSLATGVQALSGCAGIQRDLVILLDSSGSMSAEDFEKSKAFVVDLINGVTVSSSAFQIAVVRFSDRITIVNPLGRYNDNKEGLKTKVRSLVHNGGGTQTDRAIEKALDRVLIRKDNRPEAQDQILVLTDGVSDNRTATLAQAQRAKVAGIEIISVGVGSGVNDMELRNIASRDELMFKVESFADLDQIKNVLLKFACGVTTTPTPTTTTTTTTTTTKPTTTSTSTSTSASTTTSTPSTPTTVMTTTETFEFSVSLSSSNDSTVLPALMPAADDSGQFSQVPAARGTQDILSSASRMWRKVVGTTVAVFVLTALVSGLLIVVLRQLKKKRSRQLDTL